MGWASRNAGCSIIPIGPCGALMLIKPSHPPPYPQQPTAAAAANPTPAAGWLASFKAFIGQLTGSVAATLQTQTAKAKGRRAARQAARAKRRDAIKQVRTCVRLKGGM